METTQLDSLTATLRQEEARLQHQLDEHTTATKVLEKDLERIRTAIKALGGTNGQGKGKRRANSKPAASTTEVRTAVASALEEGRELTKAELKRQVEQDVTKSGKSRVGLGLRIDQVLKDKAITEAGGKYRLAAPSS